MKRRAALRLLASIVILAVLVYGFLMRTGRYQIVPLEGHLYAVIDTATGARWLYRGQFNHDTDRVEFIFQDSHAGSSLLRRTYPYRWDME